jgi:hypothetical protein
MTALRREPFWHRDARGLRLFVSLERGSHIVRIGEFEAFRQHRGILDRLHRALRHVGSIGCAASPISVTRPTVHRGSGSRS